MKLKKRILTTVLSLGIAASIGVPAAGITMAQDDTAQSDTQEKNEIVFTADGGNEILSIGQKQEEKPEDEKPVVPDRPYHEDDHDGDLILSSSYVTLDRDYAQTVKVKVKNNTNKNVNYYLEADNGNEDIYLNFVQLGSKDAPLTISPNSEQEVELSIFLQNALKESYSIPVKAYTRDGSSGDDYQETSLYTVDFLCDHGDVSFSLLAGELNEEMLSQTYTVVNNGDEITDLTVSVPDEVSRYISISPLIENYTISSGETISFDVKLDLFNMEEDGKDTITGELIAASGANKQTASVTFKKPENFQTIEAWRLALYQDDNPYYLIDEDVVIEDKIVENLESLNFDNVSEEELAEAIGINADIVDINNIETSQTYTYKDESGSNQNIVFSTSVTSEDISDSQVGTVSNTYEQEGDNVVLNTVINLSSDDYRDFLADYIDGAEEIIKSNSKGVNKLQLIRSNLSRKNIGNKALKIKTTVFDTKNTLSDGMAALGNVFRTIVALGRSVNGGYENFDVSAYFNDLSNPLVNNSVKEYKTANIHLFILEKLIDKAKDASPLGNSFYTYNWLTGFRLLSRLFNILHPENGDYKTGVYDLYYRNQVLGKQCTNAGEVENTIKVGFNNGIKFSGNNNGAYSKTDSKTISKETKHINEKISEEKEIDYSKVEKNELDKHLFSKSAMEYNNDMALYCAELSEAAYNYYGGFVKFNLDYYKYYDNDKGGLGGGTFYIGHKTIKIDGKDTVVLIITCRGTKTPAEVLGDVSRIPTLFLWEYNVFSNVYSFEEKVFKELNNYINTHVKVKNADNLKIIVTGHSLGGAAANMIGARFNNELGKKEWWSKKVSKNDIYVYTFGAIDVLFNGVLFHEQSTNLLREKSNKKKGFENIHNIYNEYDTFNVFAPVNHNTVAFFGRVSSPWNKFGHSDIISFWNKNAKDPNFENHGITNYKKELEQTSSAAKVENNENHSIKKMKGRMSEIQTVNRLAREDVSETTDEGSDSPVQKYTVQPNYIVLTGRVFPNGDNGNYLGHYDMDGQYVGQIDTEQEIIINGTSLGTVTSDVMNEMFIVGMLSEEYSIYNNNTITRKFNTDPGHYWIDTDTEYNTYIPDSTLIAYTGSLDDIEDIRALPDFAVYPENIYSGDDNYIGDRNPVTVKVYNRGPRGGWTDVEVKIDGNTVYSEENKYIGGFSGEEITFDFTPTSEKHTVSVILNNKTVDTEERTEENNTVEAKDIYFKSYEVPEIGEITPETIRLADTDEGAFVKASIAKDATVKKIIFKLDGEVVSEEAYTPGIGEASAYIPKDKLTVGEHKLTVELEYKENATTDNTISEDKLINVKIKESINFAVKAAEDSYINYRVYRKNKYDDRQYYDSVYIVDSSDSKYNAQEKQYEYKLYLDDYAEVTEDYDVIFVYNNGIELIPLKELNGSTLSMDEAKKVTVEYTDDFNNIYIAEPRKINGYNFYDYLSGWDNYRDNFLVGDGIDSLDVEVNYNISGGRDSVTETLDITKGDAVIKLVDNTKTFTFTNYSGTIQNREIVAEKDNDYYVIDCLFEAIDDNKMTAVLTNEANKTFQNADKAIFYFMDDAAIYEIDLKTFTENEIDLESIRNNYNKVSYVYEGSNTEILSRTIQRKKENSGGGTGTYEFKTDSILAATGEYIVKTKYKSNGIVLEDAQEIIVSGTDVEIVLPEAGEDLTTISVNYPDYYTNVRLAYYDDNWNWQNEMISTSGDKIIVPPGTRTFYIYANTHDGIDIELRRDIDVVEKTNTEFNINDNYAANVNISNIDSDTNIFNTTKGSSVGFELSGFKDEYGSVLANYSDYSYGWYDNYTDAKLILTDVNDSSKQYEIDYGSSVNYIYNNKTLTFTLPEEIEGDYNYKIMMTRVVPDPPIPLEEIKLDKNELTMEPDSEEELTIAYIPDDTTWSKEVWWESSDEDIVRVEDGKIKALQEGTATVTVHSVESYSISDSCEVTVKHIHDMQTVLAKDPTCTEDGNILYYICSKCDKWYEDADGEKEITDKASVVLQEFGHDYEQKVTKEASCEEAGVITFTCKNDPTHTYTEEIAALGHEWGEWEITKEAKEGTEGERTRICKTDPTHTETQIIPALPHVHTIETVSEVPASCETDGSRAHFICTTDGLLFEDPEGLTEIKDETELVVPALGHDWNEWTVSKEASCTEKGLEIRICKHDETHVEEREIEAKGHSFIKTERKEATCEVPGNTEYYTCTECGLIYADAEGTQEITLAQTIIQSLGHDWSDWGVTKEASCSEAGEETRTCAHDGEEQTRYIEPLGHEWSEWQIVRAATQTEVGERIRICAHDETHVDREIIPMIIGQDDPTDTTDKTDTIATQEEEPKQQDNTKDNEQNEEMENTSSGENIKPEDNNKNVIESNSQAESDKPRAVSAKPESDATGVIAVTTDNAETAEGSVKAVDTGDRGVALWIVLIASATFALGVTFFVGKHRKDNG